MVVLLPRLPGPASETIVRRFLDQGPGQWSGFNARDLPEAVRFAATGGTRIMDLQLMSFRESLETLAQEHGFGAPAGRAALAGFDAEAAAWLAEAELVDSGEALRDDVWNFVGAVLAPDIVHWRFGVAMERYLGGARNTFQRLWMRGRALDRGPDHPERWQLLHELTEDALVQITERPSIGGDSALALAIGEAWVRAARHNGKTAMEPVMRRAALRIRIRNEIRSLAELPAEQLVRLLDEAFGTPVAEKRDEVTSTPGLATAGSNSMHYDADDEQVRILAGATGEPADSLSEAIDRVFVETERRGWLSPKSESALKDLRSDGGEIRKSERNALDYLFGRMATASVLLAEVAQIRQAISALARSEAQEPAKPRRSRLAIWRAK